MLCCAGIFFSASNLATSLHTHIHTHIHTYSCEHMSYCFGSHDNMIYVPNITYIHTYIHTYMHTYIHTHTHTYIHTSTYVHTYTHTHTHTHIQAWRHSHQIAASRNTPRRSGASSPTLSTKKCREIPGDTGKGEDLAHQTLPSRPASIDIGLDIGIDRI